MTHSPPSTRAEPPQSMTTWTHLRASFGNLLAMVAPFWSGPWAEKKPPQRLLLRRLGFLLAHKALRCSYTPAMRRLTPYDGGTNYTPGTVRQPHLTPAHPDSSSGALRKPRRLAFLLRSRDSCETPGWLSADGHRGGNPGRRFPAETGDAKSPRALAAQCEALSAAMPAGNRATVKGD